MKIKQLKLKNFAKFEDFQLQFNDSITNLIGINGAGKTTIGLTAIWAGFKGIAEKSKSGQLIGERFRFITPGKTSSDIIITLHDEAINTDITLTRHITKTSNTIKIESSPMYPGLTKEYIENLFNISFLSASHFASLTGQQQAISLGLDCQAYDTELLAKKEDAKDYRRDIKKIGELVPVAACEKKDIVTMHEEHSNKWRQNKCRLDLKQSIMEGKTKITRIREELKAVIDKHDSNLAELRKIGEEQIDLEPLSNDIKNVIAHNEQYERYKIYINQKSELDQLNTHLSENKKLQSDIIADRLSYIQSKSFGIKGLSINDKGELTKDNKLIRTPYFSKGELEMLIARISSNLNPELKVRFIDDFELLDSANQEKLINILTKKGFQIITGQVGDKAEGENSVLLKACKVDGVEEVPSTIPNTMPVLNPEPTPPTDNDFNDEEF